MMNKLFTFLLRRTVLATALFAVFGLTSSSYAQSGHSHGKGASDASVSAEAKAAYPLSTCVVSGEQLGSMGEPFDYIHKEAGKPDRLVRFCCKMCVKDFKKEPAKYLKMIDDGAAGATAGHSDSHGHQGH